MEEQSIWGREDVGGDLEKGRKERPRSGYIVYEKKKEKEKGKINFKPNLQTKILLITQYNLSPQITNFTMNSTS